VYTGSMMVNLGSTYTWDKALKQLRGSKVPGC